MPIEIGQLTRWLRQTRDADTDDEYRRDSLCRERAILLVLIIVKGKRLQKIYNGSLQVLNILPATRAIYNLRFPRWFQNAVKCHFTMTRLASCREWHRKVRAMFMRCASNRTHRPSHWSHMSTIFIADNAAPPRTRCVTTIELHFVRFHNTHFRVLPFILLPAENIESRLLIAEIKSCTLILI